MANQSAPGSLETKIQNALTGVQQVVPTGGSLQVAGGLMTQAQLEAKLSGYLPAFEAVRTDKQVYQTAVVTRAAIEPDAREFLVQLRASLIALFGRGSPQLAKFGMGHGLGAKPSPQTQVMAAAKRILTRRARGTIGKKQAAAITVVSPPQVTLAGHGLQITPPTVDATPARAKAPQGAATPAQPTAVPVGLPPKA